MKRPKNKGESWVGLEFGCSNILVGDGRKSGWERTALEFQFS